MRMALFENAAEQTIVLCVIAFIILALGVFLGAYFKIGQGEEKESLLDFTCEELKSGRISSDGTEGRFVTDWFGDGWVDDNLIIEAMIEKECIPPPEDPLLGDFGKFDYRAVKK